VHDLAERRPDLLGQFDQVRHRVIRDSRHEDNIIGMDVLQEVKVALRDRDDTVILQAVVAKHSDGPTTKLQVKNG